MPKDIGREEVQRMAAEGAQIVDVLPRDEYDESHIPGAIGLPLDELDRESAGRALSHDRPVIVYCWDSR
ncbi:MAG: rhodanese-like domain-containing protein [Candidatus Limnocylindria bacterium]